MCEVQALAWLLQLPTSLSPRTHFASQVCRGNPEALQGPELLFLEDFASECPQQCQIQNSLLALTHGQQTQSAEAGQSKEAAVCPRRSAAHSAAHLCWEALHTSLPSSEPAAASPLLPSTPWEVLGSTKPRNSGGIKTASTYLPKPNEHHFNSLPSD